jgi:cytohesin
VWKGHVKTVAALIAAGADVSAATVTGATPLHRAAWRGDKKMVAVLLASQADMSARYEGHGELPLHRAVRNGDIEVVEMLVNAGSDIFARDSGGVTVLHIAAHCGHKDVMEFLLSLNLDVSAQNMRGETPLHWAVQQGAPWAPHKYFPGPKGDNAMVKLLLAAGANSLAVDKVGDTPFAWAALDGNDAVIQTLLDASLEASITRGGSELHRAVVEGDYDHVCYLFSKDIGKYWVGNEDRDTPLHLAAKKGDSRMVNIFLQAVPEMLERRVCKIRKAAIELSRLSNTGSVEFG